MALTTVDFLGQLRERDVDVRAKDGKLLLNAPAGALTLELQAELQQTESKLTELQTKRNDQSSIMLSPEQEAELKRFTAEKTRVRKELRETQRGLDVDINRLGARLKVVNIGIAPLAVAIAGVVILWLRRRRRSASSLATLKSSS